ncbi:RNA methylase [Nitzschia inconspicua]|uniref:RNA methylase n=1 Tax=Nitzschia inconspicua TaxID=303405 RepID=A0A9K3L2X9_9STRA|nr:RNA methylase [Nitzschia inconspicua]
MQPALLSASPTSTSSSTTTTTTTTADTSIDGKTIIATIRSNDENDKIPRPNTDDDITIIQQRKLLIHWRGEKDAGYSKPFRQLEFQGAMAAETATRTTTTATYQDVRPTFVNALVYNGNEFMPDVNVEHFNEAMQYVSFQKNENTNRSDNNHDNHMVGAVVSRKSVENAASRCSLVHAVYEIIAQSDDLDMLAELAIQDGGFEDLYKENEFQHQGLLTWCFRARSYLGDLVDSPSDRETVSSSTTTTKSGKVKRYGSNTRSMGLERKGLKALTPLLVKLGGKVDLLNPHVKIYIFDGLRDEHGQPQKVLARRIATGPRTSAIAPATRICITNTPLEPIAAFSLCNVARIKNGDKILDPYCGSGTTLLAAAMMAPTVQSVGIEIAHNGLVNRNDILQDFRSRDLTPPKQLICGDSTHADVRQQARAAVGNTAFDAIVADPPYGIRESSNYNERSPLEELFASIQHDRDAGQRLLNIGGRLVAFVPVTDQQSLRQMLPSREATEAAGLEFEVSREQPLNEKLSRWLVSFICVR